MSNYASHFSTRQTPVTEPIPGKRMVPNSTGGYVFQVDDFKRLERWLLLGADGGTFYATEKKLTVENGNCILRCLAEDAARTINTIVEASDSGRAPKNDPAIFALAIAAGHSDPAVRRLAEAAIPKVCRIGTHLFQFAEAVQNFRGWGRGLRKAVGEWYTSRDADSLAYQVVKYQQRNGWSHRDLLRLSHPSALNAAHNSVLRWATAGIDGMGPREVKRGNATSMYSPACELPRIIAAFEEAKRAGTDADGRKTIINLIREANLPRECIPTEHLNSPEVWEALLEKMPLTAMVRSLAKMTDVGLLKPLGEASRKVADRLGDREYIRKSRLHPMAILVAAKTYAKGRGDKGKLTWTPVSAVNEALDSAFYLAFDNVVPSGKKTLIALDISGSMGGFWSGDGKFPLTPREITAAMAMVAIKVEKEVAVVGFSHSLMHLDIAKCSRLTDVIAMISNLPFGATNASLPIEWAIQGKIDVDMFQVWTDNEVNCSTIHPCQALKKFRETGKPDAKLAVIACTPTNFTIADPNDFGMLDICGFSTDVPAVLADFARN